MDKIKALETLFDYAHAEVSNPTNANALFESPLIWQAEVLVAVKLLALNLGIDLSKTDIDIQSLEESIENSKRYIAENHPESEDAQWDLAEANLILKGGVTPKDTDL